jgi:hypothetical protein
MAEGRGGRHHLLAYPSGQRRVRSIYYKLRLSEEERHALRLRAAAAGVTMSRLLIDSALGAKVTVHERQALYIQWNRAAGELGKVGANLNQLAYWANTHQQDHGEAGAVAAEVHGLAAELRDLAEQIKDVLAS